MSDPCLFLGCMESLTSDNCIECGRYTGTKQEIEESMRDNTGRVLTLRVTIKDPEEAEWIWKAHLDKSIHGVTINAIAEGDLFAQRDLYRSAASFYIREEGETTEEAIEAHDCGGFDSVEDAVAKAPLNVSPGAKWAIIDIKGKVYRTGPASTESYGTISGGKK